MISHLTPAQRLAEDFSQTSSGLCALPFQKSPNLPASLSFHLDILQVANHFISLLVHHVLQIKTSNGMAPSSAALFMLVGSWLDPPSPGGRELM